MDRIVEESRFAYQDFICEIFGDFIVKDFICEIFGDFIVKVKRTQEGFDFVQGL